MPAGVLRRTQGFGHGFERGRAIFMRMREIKHLATFRRAIARLLRIGEEGDRRLGADQHQLFDIGEEIDDLLGEIGNAFDGDAARAALQARREGIAHQPRAAGGGDAAGGLAGPFP